MDNHGQGPGRCCCCWQDRLAMRVIVTETHTYGIDVPPGIAAEGNAMISVWLEEQGPPMDGACVVRISWRPKVGIAGKAAEVLRALAALLDEEEKA